MLPPNWQKPWPNVWLGCTVVNQEEADRDIPKLLNIPAAVRFLSVEPMLGPISLQWLAADHDQGVVDALLGCAWIDGGDKGLPHDVAFHGTGKVIKMRRWVTQVFDSKIDWVICGGESGTNARPIHPDWARSLRDQCVAAGVAFLFKQWGEWAPALHDPEYDGHVLRQTETVGSFDGWKANVYDPDRTEGVNWRKLGKSAAGRLLDGREWNEVPQ